MPTGAHARRLMPVPDRITGHKFNRTEPDIIDADMSRADIVFALEHLSFRANGLSKAAAAGCLVRAATSWFR
jgi:hypothetical protein